MREHFEPVACAFGIYRRDDALTAELLRAFSDYVRPSHGLGVDRDLVGSREQESTNVFDRADTAPHRQRHEAGRCSAPYDVEKNGPLLVARGDIEKTELIGSCGVVDDRLL